MLFKQRIPGGNYSRLYADMASQTHCLVAGRTGSGKSVVVNGIIHYLLCTKSSAEAQLILIDPKRVELSQWRAVPHCIRYASEPEEMVSALRYAMSIIEKRFQDMEKQRERKYSGGDIYVVIDELADLLTTQKRDVLPLLQRIGQIGRAAKVHLVACTQSPTAAILSTQLRCNFNCILGLKTRSAQDSRNITGCNGCERLPDHGCGYYVSPKFDGVVTVPMIPDAELARVEKHWTNRLRYTA